jgi:molybdopterin synthase catalytic subunit
MIVSVRLFAIHREVVGKSKVDLELPDGATAGEAWEKLRRLYPRLQSFSYLPAMAVNADFAAPDTVLQDGDEVAFIPPVAGGGDGPFRIVQGPIDEQALADAVAHPAAGAVITFVGTVRNHSGDRQVEHLEYEAYPEMAERVMQRIATEVRERWPVTGIAIEHRVGRLEIGEASVVIAVSAGHREEAFAACRYAIDRIKEILPVWKKEVWDGGETWIEEGPGQPAYGESVA